MTTITQTITALPPAPDPASPSTFASLAAPFAQALPTLGTEINAWKDQANTVAGEVSTNASNAATSASNAATSASDAAASASSASTSASDAAALFDFFDDRCLGAKSADPVTDNDGNPLQDGAWYINSGTGALRAYTAAGGWVQGIAAVAGVTSINGQAGEVVLNLPGLDFSLFQQGVI